MLEMLVRNSDFAALSKLISPSFFKVVPVPQLIGVGGRILANTRTFSAEQPELQKSRDLLSQAGWSISFERTATRPELTTPIASQVLELYFLQISLCDTWLLDFRSSSFHAASGKPLIWSPGPYFLRLSSEFLASVRNLYAGFYLGDSAKFQKALEGLGVSAARSVLEEHFGLEGQSHVQFKLAEFEQTFAKVFQACAKGGERIAPEFTALGILLLTLYENLESTGEAFDVRGAFLKAQEKATHLQKAAIP